jgi:phage regulator Rha-like protein
MTKDLVVIKNGEPVTDSLKIASGLKLQHRAIVQLIRRYQDRFIESGNGTFTFEMLKSGGRPTPVATINEENAVFLITLIRNSDLSVEFKHKLSKSFMKMKKALIQKYSNEQNAEWVERRKMGISQRKEQTDIIKRFVDYAMDSGSKNAFRYYGNITTMQNRALFFLTEKFPNLRDIMDASQLIVISAADQIVLKTLRDGMSEGLPYKDIYKRAKESVESFAKIIGKSPLPKYKLINDTKQIEMF